MSDSCLTTHDTYSLSVVIATLGGESLRGTIEQLNRGTVVPDEILVCIPEEDAYKVATFSIPNVRVIKTDQRGQVAQRIAGFHRAGGKYIMQLDDDVMVDEYCIERLVDVLASSSGNYAVSPALRHIETDRSVYSKWSKNKIVRQMYYFLINGDEGYKPGTVTKAGTEIGVDPDLSDVMHHDVDWLPGGCVVHCRNNLVLSNYYPYSGKAYCEDMYHSRCLRAMGVKMLIASEAIAWIVDSRNEKVSFWNWWKELLREYSTRRHYLSATANNYMWMHIYYIIRCFGYMLKTLRRIVKSCRI